MCWCACCVVVGLDYVSHDDILPYTSTSQDPFQHELFDQFLALESKDDGTYVNCHCTCLLNFYFFLCVYVSVCLCVFMCDICVCVFMYDICVIYVCVCVFNTFNLVTYV